MSQHAAALPKNDSHTLTWWLAAGLVGADIGTSVFYSTGVIFPAVGFMAPVFILAVALIMWFFKLSYQEGCSVNPLNGGAYSMVLQTIGRRAALVVGSLTILSYLATAVVSALAGSFYLSTLWSQPWPLWLVVLVAAVPLVLFGALNLVGIQESAKVVFGISAFHFLLLLTMDGWGLVLAFTQGAHWERFLTGFHGLPPQALVVGFASAFLGITGFESAAQIIEVIEKPVDRSIRKIYLTIVLLVSITAPLSSFLCMALLSNDQIGTFRDAFLSGLAFNEGGHKLLVVLVLDACLTLFAAVNTAYAGVTGLMTTMGKQGNLPTQVLKRWTERLPLLQGFPYVVLPFMLLCIGMLIAMPGSVDSLGNVYGMAFLGVMISYLLGVVLLRVAQPLKVARAPYKNRWTFPWKHVRLPVAPFIGTAFLAFAEAVLLLSAQDARTLGIQLFLAVLLLMVYYRLGRVETRMVKLPDLRLGLGGFRRLPELPNLPTYLCCVATPTPKRMVTLISHMIKTYGENIEILLFHAEETQSHHQLFELERLVSQELEAFFADRNVILSVKVLPGNLDEVLPEYCKTRAVEKVFITTGADAEASEAFRFHLSNELGIDVVRLEEKSLPKGPAVWFEQWILEFRRNARSESPAGAGDNG